MLDWLCQLKAIGSNVPMGVLWISPSAPSTEHGIHQGLVLILAVLLFIFGGMLIFEGDVNLMQAVGSGREARLGSTWWQGWSCPGH